MEGEAGVTLEACPCDEDLIDGEAPVGCARFMGKNTKRVIAKMENEIVVL
jgi:hypothetical protein